MHHERAPEKVRHPSAEPAERDHRTWQRLLVTRHWDATKAGHERVRPGACNSPHHATHARSSGPATRKAGHALRAQPPDRGRGPWALRARCPEPAGDGRGSALRSVSGCCKATRDQHLVEAAVELGRCGAGIAMFPLVFTPRRRAWRTSRVRQRHYQRYRALRSHRQMQRSAQDARRPAHWRVRGLRSTRCIARGFRGAPNAEAAAESSPGRQRTLECASAGLANLSRPKRKCPIRTRPGRALTY